MPGSRNPFVHLCLSMLSILVVLLSLGCAKDADGSSTPASSSTTPTTSSTPKPAGTQRSLSLSPDKGGDLFLLSLVEGGYAHLFAYSPGMLSPTRLTDGNWNDLAPAISPDGKLVAFASNRSGYYNLYLLDLASGQTTRLTDTAAYDGAPSWSPDQHWLAYETYLDDNLEIVLMPLDEPSQSPVRLTHDPAADYSPAWSPQGRQVAFVSTRSGDSEVWLADLDQIDQTRFRDLSNTSQATESHPAWSPDGGRLAWASSSQDSGFSGLYLWDGEYPNRPPNWIGAGDWPAWNARGDQLVTELSTPNQDYLSAYTLDGELLLQPTLLPGTLRGLLWGKFSLPNPLPKVYRQASAQTPTALWKAPATPLSSKRRSALVPLKDVQAPYSSLLNGIDQAFSALRRRTISETGWDALAGLQDAFIPLTTPLDPGLGEDWLYTGRAFALNPATTSAGWMAAVRQDFGQQTYWRLYLRARTQDGSQGEPLHDPPWDLSARYNLDPQTYEQGGQYIPIPSGYWIDFTELAQQYGWERMPALPNWRTFYNGTRFTEFAMTDDLSWYEAMLELYPPEALITPTVVVPPTITPTRTPTNSPTPWMTPTPTPPASATSTPTGTSLPYLPTSPPATP
jgi:TolB protein